MRLRAEERDLMVKLTRYESRLDGTPWGFLEGNEEALVLDLIERGLLKTGSLPPRSWCGLTTEGWAVLKASMDPRSSGIMLMDRLMHYGEMSFEQIDEFIEDRGLVFAEHLGLRGVLESFERSGVATVDEDAGRVRWI